MFKKNSLTKSLCVKLVSFNLFYCGLPCNNELSEWSHVFLWLWRPWSKSLLFPIGVITAVETVEDWKSLYYKKQEAYSESKSNRLQVIPTTRSTSYLGRLPWEWSHPRKVSTEETLSSGVIIFLIHHSGRRRGKVNVKYHPHPGLSPLPGGHRSRWAEECLCLN